MEKGKFILDVRPSPAGEAGSREMQHSSQEPLADLWKKSLLIEAFSRHQNDEYGEIQVLL